MCALEIHFLNLQDDSNKKGLNGNMPFNPFLLLSSFQMDMFGFRIGMRLNLCLTECFMYYFSLQFL